VKRANIDLRIEEIVVEGMSRGDAGRLAHATKRELERLLADRELPEDMLRMGPTTRSSPVRLEVASSTSPEGTGSRVAAAIHGAIGRRETRAEITPLHYPTERLSQQDDA
jgi:hypothetical protein